MYYFSFFSNTRTSILWVSHWSDADRVKIVAFLELFLYFRTMIFWKTSFIPALSQTFNTRIQTFNLRIQKFNPLSQTKKRNKLWFNFILVGFEEVEGKVDCQKKYSCQKFICMTMCIATKKMSQTCLYSCWLLFRIFFTI